MQSLHVDDIMIIVSMYELDHTWGRLQILILLYSSLCYRITTDRHQNQGWHVLWRWNTISKKEGFFFIVCIFNCCLYMIKAVLKRRILSNWRQEPSPVYVHAWAIESENAPSNFNVRVKQRRTNRSNFAKARSPDLARYGRVMPIRYQG
jgi:hypothetical protein